MDGAQRDGYKEAIHIEKRSGLRAGRIISSDLGLKPDPLAVKQGSGFILTNYFFTTGKSFDSARVKGSHESVLFSLVILSYMKLLFPYFSVLAS